MSMATGESIPVVDFRDVPVDSAVDVSSHPQLVKQLHAAFKKVGFVFIRNHGIKRELIDHMFSCARDFFDQPFEIKRGYLRRVGGEDDTGNSGYVAVEQESVNPANPGDLKECFQVSAVESLNIFENENLPPKFKPLFCNLYTCAISLGKTVLEFMGHALQLEDPLFFVKNHQNAGSKGNYTTARLLHYPPIPSSVKPGQLRCGEHVDYGSITLLFQDPSGGLQVKRSDGGYIDVPYMADAVLVNLGVLVQMWTADNYLATPHRVLIPEDEVKRSKARQSIAIFLHPDDDTIIRCLDNSNKYPETTAYQDTNNRLDRSYDKSFQ